MLKAKPEKYLRKRQKAQALASALSPLKIILLLSSPVEVMIIVIYQNDLSDCGSIIHIQRSNILTRFVTRLKQIGAPIVSAPINPVLIHYDPIGMSELGKLENIANISAVQLA